MYVILGMYLALVPLTFIYSNLKTETGRVNSAGVIFKGAATLSIILAALAGITLRGGAVSAYDKLIVAGLTLGLVGDMVIVGSLVGGMLAFALGHFCYMGALLTVADNPLTAVPIWIITYAAMFFVYRKSGVKLGRYGIPAYIYSAVIFAMLSLAFTVPVLLPAAVLFTASDFLLAIVIFDKPDAFISKVSLWCYYIGQSLFAVSVIMGI